MGLRERRTEGRTHNHSRHRHYFDIRRIRPYNDLSVHVEACIPHENRLRPYGYAAGRDGHVYARLKQGEATSVNKSLTIKFPTPWVGTGIPHSRLMRKESLPISNPLRPGCVLQSSASPAQPCYSQAPCSAIRRPSLMSTSSSRQGIPVASHTPFGVSRRTAMPCPETSGAASPLPLSPLCAFSGGTTS